MKLKSIISILIVLALALTLAACGGGDTPPDTTTATPTGSKTPSGETTKAPGTDPASAGTTKASAETTKAPVATTPATSETTAPLAPVNPIEFNDLTDAEKSALKAVMPETLPDNVKYEIQCRTMCFDRGEDDYLVEGNSKGSVTYVDEAGGAVYGKAIKFAAKADEKDARGEIQVSPFEDVVVQGAKGILFYVDFNNVAPAAEADKLCASVTMNTNAVRSQGPTKEAGSAVAYYYLSGAWVQTTNITSCRMQIPDNFAGWIYVPASSYYQETAGTYWDTATNTFIDIFVTNMRCYTDGYVYSADSYVIFDEITFVR